MDFEEALEFLKDGKKIAREEWLEDDIHLVIRVNEKIVVTVVEGEGYIQSNLLWENILANDWVLVDNG